MLSNQVEQRTACLNRPWDMATTVLDDIVIMMTCNGCWSCAARLVQMNLEQVGLLLDSQQCRQHQKAACKERAVQLCGWPGGLCLVSKNQSRRPDHISMHRQLRTQAGEATAEAFRLSLA